MAHEVFISYTTQNKTAADGVCAGLERERLRCWIAPRDVLPGSNYGESIINAIESARVVVLIFSSASNFSQAVHREMERAMHFAKPIIPFRLEDVPVTKGMEFYLASCHWLDAMSPPIEQHISRLASAVHGLLGREWSGSVYKPTPAARWRRTLLIGAAILALIATGTGIFLFANRRKAPEHERSSATKMPGNIPAGLSLSVQVRNPGEELIRDAFDTTPDAMTRVRYEFQRHDGLVQIKPRCAYLQAIADHAVLPVLPAAGSRGTHLEASPLTLVLQLLNDTAKALSVHRIELKVSESTAELEPVLVVNIDSTGLRICNEGWAKVEKATLRFTSPKVAGSTVALEGFEGKRLIAWSEIIGSGTPPLPLPKVTGAIEYHWFNKDDVRNTGSLSFESTPAEPIAQKSPATATGTDEIAPPLELEFDKTAYSVTGPLARQIAPGEHDQIEVLVNAPRSSHHRFHLLVHYNDGQDGVLRSPEIDLEYFMPRSVGP